MTTKFNQELYTKIKAKKNEPLSSISAWRLRVVEKEKEKEVTKKGLSTPTLDEGRSASPGVFIEEVIPAKKRKTGDKGKKKVGASIWVDAGTTMARANEVMTPEELKEISNVPSHEMVNRHVHKLVQVLGETMHITSQYLLNEKKAVVATFKAEALKAEAFGLRRDLIMAMDVNNTSKENIQALTEQLNTERLLVKQKDKQIVTANQKIKSVIAKAIHAFQLTDEYNAVLFGCTQPSSTGTWPFSERLGL
ncbi:uncharacterized protein LOC115961667 [Quercus lobata]|uniref:uncharacterized protein LOC115961667 n=1 Tax=Quercus lobata TaxID=97700 RepID=UPI001248D6DB|nr:uncharacterized protein LOC115961667 [Quercus lobata]